MGKREKRFNKRVIGMIIGGAVVGGLSATKKGRSFWGRTRHRLKGPLRFLRRGYREMKKEVEERK